MSENSPLRARIEIEAGFDGPRHRFHRIFINGQDVGLQVSSFDFRAEGGEPCEVRVTFIDPELKIKGFANVIAPEDGDDRG